MYKPNINNPSKIEKVLAWIVIACACIGLLSWIYKEIF